MSKYPIPVAAPYGLTPAAWNAYKLASDGAGVDIGQHPKLRLTQTIGNAKASAGVHLRDGFVTVDGRRVPYCAAIDLSVLWLTTSEIRAWLDHLAWWGFAGWYRPWETDGKPNHHIHCISCHAAMKPALDNQVDDFLHDRNGLKGHAREKFYTAGEEQDRYIRALWRWSNQSGPKPPSPPKAPKSPTPPVNVYRQLWDVSLSGKEIGHAVAIDGAAWFPVREWYKHLGIEKDASGRQLVKWAPEVDHVFVQGRELKADVKLLDLGDGEGRRGYVKITDLVEFSGLGLTRRADAGMRRIEVAKV